MGWVVNATPRPLYPQRKRAGAHCIGGWLGPRAGLEGCGKSRPHRDSILGPSRPWRVALPTELSRPTHTHTHTHTHIYIYIYIYIVRTNWKKYSNCERYTRPLCEVRNNDILCSTKSLLNFYITETNVQQRIIVLLCTVLNHSHFQLWNNLYKKKSKCISLDLDKNV